jgi:F0F1-type ATP synthase assembly protein I
MAGGGSYVQIADRAPSCTGSLSDPLAMSEVLVRSHRLVARIVLMQAGCALIVASLFLFFASPSAGLAALVGGLIVAVGSAVFGWRVFKPGIAAAATLNKAMYAGVALKWLWFALALYVSLAKLKLDSGPLLIGLVAASVGYWAGLMRSSGP